MKTILLVNASHRKNGNSEAIINTLAADLNDQHVVSFTIREKDCRYCRACFACHRAGTGHHPCVQDDDIAKLAPVIETCDAIVMATPIYIQQVSSLARLFIERFYPWFNPNGKGLSNTKKYGKKAAFICSFGNCPRELIKKYADWTVSTFSQIGAEHFSTLIFDKIPQAGDVKKRPDYMEQIHNLSQWLKQ